MLENSFQFSTVAKVGFI